MEQQRLGALLVLLDAQPHESYVLRCPCDGALHLKHCCVLVPQQEQSITLWNDMHAVADALEEAEKAASLGWPRPANVNR